MKETYQWGKTDNIGIQNVTIDLRQRLGKVLKLCLKFPGAWLAISEVYFKSGKSNSLYIQILYNLRINLRLFFETVAEEQRFDFRTVCL